MRLVLIKGLSEYGDDPPTEDILRHQDTIKKVGAAVSTDETRAGGDLNLDSVLVSDKHVAATDGHRVHVWHHGGSLTRQGAYDPDSLVRRKGQASTSHIDRALGMFGKLEYTPETISKEKFLAELPRVKKQKKPKYTNAKKVGTYFLNEKYVKDAVSFVGKNHEIHVDKSRTNASPVRFKSADGQKEAYVLPYDNRSVLIEKKKSTRPVMTFDNNGQLQTFEHEKLRFDKRKNDKEGGLKIDPEIREDKYKKIYSSNEEEFHVSKKGMEGRGVTIDHRNKKSGRLTIYGIEKEPSGFGKTILPRKYQVDTWHSGSGTFPDISLDTNHSLNSINHSSFKFGKFSGIEKMPLGPTTIHDSPTDKIHVVPHEDGNGATVAHYDKVAGNIRIHSIEKTPDIEGDRWSVTSETFKP